KKQVTLGFVTTGVALQGWNGNDWAKGTRYRSMRVIFPMYDTAFQFIAAKRFGLHWLDDFSGLRVGAGPRAGTGGPYGPEVFHALGIKGSVRFGAMESMAAQLQAGDLDGAVFATGFPVPVLTTLIATHPVDFVRPSPDQIATIRQKLPEISQSLVPARTYPTQERDYATIGLYNFAVAHKDLPDDLIYTIVKAAFDNHEELVMAHSSAKETVPAIITRDTVLPMHPGAERYYRAIGVPIPVDQTHRPRHGSVLKCCVFRPLPSLPRSEVLSSAPRAMPRKNQSLLRQRPRRKTRACSATYCPCSKPRPASMRRCSHREPGRHSIPVVAGTPTSCLSTPRQQRRNSSPMGSA